VLKLVYLQAPVDNMHVSHVNCQYIHDCVYYTRQINTTWMDAHEHNRCFRASRIIL